MKTRAGWVGACVAALLFNLAAASSASAADSFAGLKAKAEAGDAAAQNNLGFVYVTGDGVTKDVSEAAKWWRKSAEQGNADAQSNLGFMCYDGTGAAKDLPEALKWWRKAADQGLARAQFNLGNMYIRGEGVTKDPAEGIIWFRKAAERGYAAAQFNLGNCYSDGDGVAKDPTEAVKWYRKAAEQGYVDAQLNLGVMYVTGAGVMKDDMEALAWFYVSSLSGDKEALNSYAKLAYRLGPQALPAARQRSNEILKLIESKKANGAGNGDVSRYTGEPGAKSIAAAPAGAAPATPPVAPSIVVKDSTSPVDRLAVWRSLTSGMSMEAVRRLLGEPSRAKIVGDYELWDYSTGGEVSFKKSVLAQWKSP